MTKFLGPAISPFVKFGNKCVFTGVLIDGLILRLDNYDLLTTPVHAIHLCVCVYLFYVVGKWNLTK